MDVLYAINTKKESAVLNAPRSAESPLSVTNSSISIVDLLGYVNQFFPDILPESVLRKGLCSTLNKILQSPIYPHKP